MRPEAARVAVRDVSIRRPAPQEGLHMHDRTSRSALGSHQRSNAPKSQQALGAGGGRDGSDAAAATDGQRWRTDGRSGQREEQEGWRR